ncbi:MAG: hypothetical protein WCF65_01810 [Parachlamydiaceae bacterium]
MKNNTKYFWRICAWIAVIILIIFILARIYYTLTDDFRLNNISYELPHEKNWVIADSTQEQERQILQILDQPFSYLGKGAQSYAFASKDGQYVIKFFKFKHLRPSWFVDILPPAGFLKTYKDKQSARKTRKLFGVFHSYKLAYDVDRDDSGLIFIQLNTENNPQRTVTVIDKIGFSRNIDLSGIPFILQYKGETLRTVLSGLLKLGDVHTAETRIGQIIDLYSREYSQGIYDHDHGILQNTGFVGSTPIHLDVGKLVREEKMRDPTFKKQDLSIVALKINHWVEKNFPHYSGEIAAYIDEKIK